MSYSGLFIQLLIIWLTRMRLKLISHFFDAYTLPLAKYNTHSHKLWLEYTSPFQLNQG